MCQNSHLPTLSEHGGIDYRGVVYLVDRVTQAKGAPR